MARTPLSLAGIARTIRRLGHDPVFTGYLAALESFTTVRDRVRRRLMELRSPFVCIGHSLGGLLLRGALGDLEQQPEHLVFLGTPQRSPVLARKYRHLWPYRIVNGEMGQLLADEAFFGRLPAIRCPYTVVAGVAGRTGKGRSFGDQPNDGVVAVSETLVHADDQPVLIPARHTFLMNHREVRAVIARVLAAEAY